MRQFGDPAAFARYHGMSPESFDDVLSRVRVRITKMRTNCRDPLSPELKLSTTLNFLRHGTCFTGMEAYTYVPVSTMAGAKGVVREVCDALYEVLAPEFLRLPSTSAEWEQIASAFEKRWNYPNCIGALDGKHVQFQSQPNSGSLNYNYKVISRPSQYHHISISQGVIPTYLNQ